MGLKWCLICTCSWHKSMKSCQSIPGCKLVVLVLQYYIRYNGTGIYCKITHMNSVKYELMFVQFESVKNSWKVFTETGLFAEIGLLWVHQVCLVWHIQWVLCKIEVRIKMYLKELILLFYLTFGVRGRQASYAKAVSVWLKVRFLVKVMKLFSFRLLL